MQNIRKKPAMKIVKVQIWVVLLMALMFALPNKNSHDVMSR
jgi:hypothetical protein